MGWGGAGLGVGGCWETWSGRTTPGWPEGYTVCTIAMESDLRFFAESSPTKLSFFAYGTAKRDLVTTFNIPKFAKDAGALGPPRTTSLATRCVRSSMAAPLLVPTIERSDGPSITVMVESLAPARGYAIEVTPSLTVAELKERYLALTRRELEQLEQLEAGSGGCACPFQTALRLILDGVELEDGATLESCGVVSSSRLCVVSLRSRAGCWRLVACASHWWPLGLAVLLWGALYAAALLAPGAGDADADTSRCTLRLRALLLTGAPLLLPFGLVVAGRFQESRGRRLLWFLRHSGLVSQLVVVAGVLSCAWLTLGGVWLFGATCDAVARDAWRGAAPGRPAAANTTLLYDSALGAWVLLLLLNTAWLLLPVTALLLLCRCPLAFSLIACLSGAQGGTMQQ